MTWNAQAGEVFRWSASRRMHERSGADIAKRHTGTGRLRVYPADAEQPERPPAAESESFDQAGSLSKSKFPYRGRGGAAHCGPVCSGMRRNDAERRKSAKNGLFS
jgi:hypothetical protein